MATPTITPTPDPDNSIGALSYVDPGGTTDEIFEIVPFEIPTADPTSVAMLSLDWDNDDISWIGSWTVTLINFVVQQPQLPTLVMVMLAMTAVGFLFRFVTDAPRRAKSINVTGAIDTAADVGALPDEVSAAQIKRILRRLK